MTERISAGILLYRRTDGGLEVLLAHPGGPRFAARDEGYWSIPKGEVEPGEALEAAARREFEEETGLALGSVELVPLGETIQKWTATRSRPTQERSRAAGPSRGYGPSRTTALLLGYLHRRGGVTVLPADMDPSMVRGSSRRPWPIRRPARWPPVRSSRASRLCQQLPDWRVRLSGTGV